MSLRPRPISKSRKIKVGITMGDPSGIGPAITLKAIDKLSGAAEFLLIGDSWVFSRVKNLNLKAKNCRVIDLHNVSHKNFSFGKVKAEYGRASIEYLDKALELIAKNAIDCLVTCPISKKAINLAGFGYSGHTEYLGQLIPGAKPVMMLLNKQLKFCLATRHIPLTEVSFNLSKDKLAEVILTAHKSLRKLFSIKKPRIVVCGLNPHASDNGVIGWQENEVIGPAVNQLKNKVKNLTGPVSSDVAISQAYKGLYDCVIAMYHDQAMIPLKLCLGFSGVNITLGLPFIRTSPLHGTAFDIAANPALANPGSLIEAISLAVKCALNQKKD